MCMHYMCLFVKYYDLNKKIKHQEREREREREREKEKEREGERFG